jgi:hypothetical protein
MAEESKSETMAERSDSELRQERRQYTSPALRRLGTVRSLTLTGGMTVTDGSLNRKRHM